MTFKQKLKLVNLIFALLAMCCLIIPTMKDTTQNYNLFQLVVHNGFRFFALVLIISLIATFLTSFLQVYYDDSNALTIINLIFGLITLILSILIKVISAPTSDIIWDEYAKLYIGSFILIPSISICFITSLIIVFRTLVLKKNDIEEIDEPEDIEIVSNSSETQIDDNEYLINEFNNK